MLSGVIDEVARDNGDIDTCNHASRTRDFSSEARDGLAYPEALHRDLQLVADVKSIVEEARVATAHHEPWASRRSGAEIGESGVTAHGLSYELEADDDVCPPAPQEDEVRIDHDARNDAVRALLHHGIDQAHRWALRQELGDGRK